MNAKKSREYQKGFKEGYHKCMHDHNILHGKDAEKLLKEMKDAEDGKISANTKKFLKECAEAVKKTYVDKPGISCSQCNFESSCYDKEYVGTSYCSFRPKRGKK